MKQILNVIAIICLNSIAFGQNISGTYHVGEPNYDASLDHPWKRGSQTVEIKYKPSDFSIELIYSATERPMRGVPAQFDLAAVEKGEYYVFTMSNVGPNCYINADLLQIEEGIFVVAPATKAGMDGKITRAEKSAAPVKGAKVYPVESLVREFILGKDKARVDYLCAHPEVFEPLLYAAVEKRHKSQHASIAQSNPKPAAGMTDANLNKEVYDLIKAWSIAKRWPQTLESAYIKSTDWEILKTGSRIIGRQITCVYIMSSNGECQWKEFIVKQDYTDGTYGKSYVGGELPGGYATSCN